jgi:hypothetical protein
MQLQQRRRSMWRHSGGHLIVRIEKVTLADVAREAGVSAAKVSRLISGGPWVNAADSECGEPAELQSRDAQDVTYSLLFSE